jgi:hypothetical protein
VADDVGNVVWRVSYDEDAGLGSRD